MKAAGKIKEAKARACWRICAKRMRILLKDRQAEEKTRHMKVKADTREAV